MDDSTILALFFARDEQAIQETDAKYGALCQKIANHILASPEDARECVNDTYWSLWNSIPPANPANLMAYICKTARNLSLKKLEYNSALKRGQNLTVSYQELESILPDRTPTVLPEYENLGDIISSFLETETEDARNIFIRRYYFFDSVREISDRYAYSESKIKNSLLRTRNRLRKHLRKEGICV